MHRLVREKYKLIRLIQTTTGKKCTNFYCSVKGTKTRRLLPCTWEAAWTVRCSYRSLGQRDVRKLRRKRRHYAPCNAVNGQFRLIQNIASPVGGKITSARRDRPSLFARWVSLLLVARWIVEPTLFGTSEARERLTTASLRRRGHRHSRLSGEASLEANNPLVLSHLLRA